MLPLAGLVVEAVPRQEAPGVEGDLVDGGQDEVDLGLRHEPDKVEAHEAGAQILAIHQQGRLEGCRRGSVHAEQGLAVRPGALAPAPGLDAVDVVEDGGDEVVVEEEAAAAIATTTTTSAAAQAAAPDQKGHDRQARGRGAAGQQRDARVGPERAKDAVGEAVLHGGDVLLASEALDVEGQACSHRADDVRRAPLLALLAVGQVAVRLVGDVEDGAAAGRRRHGVVEEPLLGDEDSRRPRPAGELVRAEEDRVLVDQGPVLADADRVHVYRHVRRRRRVVPARERAVAVQHGRDGVRVLEDAGHVRGGREGADLEAAPAAKLHEPGLEVLVVDGARDRVLGNRDHVRVRLAPRQQVAVVLVRPDEDDRPVGGGEVGRERQVQAEDLDELADRPGAPAPGEEHHVRVAVPRALRHLGPHRLRHELPGLVPEARRLEPRDRGRGVRVAVEGQHFSLDVVLDHAQGPAARRPVGVEDPPRAKGTGEDRVPAHDGGADEGGRGGGGGGGWAR